MKKTKKSISVNAFLNSIRSILNILFPIITFPYVSHVLKVQGIGIYNFSSSIVSYFVLIAGLGIATYAIREGAKLRNNKEEISEFASEIFTINIVSTLISYLLLFICLLVFKKLRVYSTCILILSTQILFTTLGTEWIYQIYEDYSFITIRSIIFQLLSIFLLFIFVKKPQDYLNYAVISAFSIVGSNILNFVYARQYCRITITWNFNWRKHILPIMILFFANVANMIYINSDITVLGILKNDYIVGIYSVSAKVYSIVKTLISALLIVTVPRLAMLFGQKRVREYNSILTKLTNTLLILVLPASVGLFMLAREVVLIISGANYLKSTTSLRILCCAYVFSILSWILNDCVLIPAKRERSVLKSMSISAIINIAFNVIFIPVWNENAAAISTVMAEFSMLVVNYYSSKDLVRDIYFSKTMFKNFVTSCVGCLGIIGICMLCDISYRSLILKTIISVILSVIIYFAILFLLKNKIAEDMVNKILKTVRLKK